MWLIKFLLKFVYRPNIIILRIWDVKLTIEFNRIEYFRTCYMRIIHTRIVVKFDFYFTEMNVPISFLNLSDNEDVR